MRLPVLFVVLLLPLTGCCSVESFCNPYHFDHKRPVYGGVRYAVTGMHKVPWLVFLDFPLSFVVDTALLPVTVASLLSGDRLPKPPKDAEFQYGDQVVTLPPGGAAAQVGRIVGWQVVDAGGRYEVDVFDGVIVVPEEWLWSLRDWDGTGRRR